jgi:hypothetical protein
MCGCNEGAKAPEELFTVTLPDGSTKVVTGEHAAKVEVTMAGGGSYSRK